MYFYTFTGEFGKERKKQPKKAMKEIIKTVEVEPVEVLTNGHNGNGKGPA